MMRSSANKRPLSGSNQITSMSFCMCVCVHTYISFVAPFLFASLIWIYYGSDNHTETITENTEVLGVYEGQKDKQCMVTIHIRSPTQRETKC